MTNISPIDGLLINPHGGIDGRLVGRERSEVDRRETDPRARYLKALATMSDRGSRFEIDQG